MSILPQTLYGNYSQFEQPETAPCDWCGRDGYYRHDVDANLCDSCYEEYEAGEDE